MKPGFLLLLLLPFIATAQKSAKDTVLIYLDEKLEPAPAKKAAFQGVAVKVENAWLVYAFYADTTPILKAYFKDKNLKVKEGPYIAYYPKNKKAKEGHYINNQMAGIWRFWYENGNLKDSGRIENNHLSGPWKSWHPNGKLMSECYFKENLSEAEQNSLYLTSTTGQPPFAGIRSGKYTSWYSNGIKESEGEFSSNSMIGDWHWYHPNGAPSTIETYIRGTVVNLQCFDTTGKPSPDLCSIQAPALLKEHGDYKAFLYENLTWPEAARKKKIQGDVLVRFQVTKEGKLKILELKGDQPVLVKAVEDFFSQMQDWYPAISHNRVVVWEDEITIPFRTGNYFTVPPTQSDVW